MICQVALLLTLLTPGSAAAPGSLLESNPASGASVDRYADNACVQCHRDLSGRSSEIVILEWEQSVHYGANVGCEGCHGGNAALKREQFDSDEAFKRASHLERSADFLVMHRSESEFVSTARGRSVSYFCGKCHSDIKEKHLGSPHGDFGDPTCLYCHGQGSHRITEPSPELIDTRGRSEGGRCSPCHRAATMEVVARIKQTLLDTTTQMQEAAELYAQLEQWGYHNLELEQLHHHGAEINSQLRQIFHSFNMREINNFASEIQATAERTAATHELIGHLRQARVRQATIGGGVVLMLLAFAALLLYYKRAFLEHHGPEPDDDIEAENGIASPPR